MARKMRLTDFGISVKSELDRRGMTQRELARQCGIDYHVVNDVLMGRNRKEENIRLIRDTLAIPS
ncbi:MAG: XRE family transcriptional regulator [Lachnospiraceae bacterium]|nr:XRE family transcriptional regulator [Lachnospiraceae bacterium]